MMVTICTTGFLGAAAVAGLVARGIIPGRLASYPQRGDASRAFERIQALAAEHDIPFERTTAPTFGEAEWAVFIGWQYRVALPNDRLIVIHDSLLPRYRGFAPTATALINGDAELGVTAIRPVEEIDAGPILGQRRWAVEYPVKARDAIERQAASTAELIAALARQIESGTLEAVEQNAADATYSLWRDSQDYAIDWSRSADEICRTVDALGYPFAGARTRVDDEAVIVDAVRQVDDLHFERRDIGKIWELDAEGPVVVCGTGCIKITAARRSDGTAYVFQRLRCRLT